MKNTKKTAIITALCLVLAGILICLGVLIFSGFDLGKLDNAVYITNEYVYNEEVRNINIKGDTTDISFYVSEDGKCKVICFEDEKLPHSVSLQNGNLTITNAQKHWRDYIKLFNLRSPKVAVFLPEEMYDSIIAETDTGYLRIDGINATRMELETHTGNLYIDNITYAEFIDAEVSAGSISIKNTICGNLNAEASTGDISLLGVNAMEIDAEVSTGDISLTNTTAQGNISAEASTGDIIFEASDGKNIFAETSTGDIKGTILTSKTFNATTDTGNVNIPQTQGTGIFEATTSTGDITISYSVTN